MTTRRANQVFVFRGLIAVPGARLAQNPLRENSNFMNRIKTVVAFKMRPQK